MSFESQNAQIAPTSESHHWRRRFVELSEDVFRELGHAQPAMTHDEDAPLSMELAVDGVGFEVTHAPGLKEDEVLIASNIGVTTMDRPTGVWTALLAANQHLVRRHRSMSVDPGSNVILHVARLQLADSSAPSLLAMASEMAALARSWFALLQADDFVVLEESVENESVGGRSAEAIEHRAVFASLIDELQRLTGSDAQVLAGSGSNADLTVEMTLQGVPFRLSHGTCSDSGLFAVECCFGEIPKDQAEAVLLRMLHINRALADATTAAAFAIERATGAAVFAGTHTLDMPDGRALLDVMTWLAVEAKEWGSSFFLEEGSGPELSGLLVADIEIV